MIILVVRLIARLAMYDVSRVYRGAEILNIFIIVLQSY